MDAHYISFTHVNDPEKKLLVVYPSELRRQYVPMASEQTQNIQGTECSVMRMGYTNSDCIVRLACSDGVFVLFDAVLVILKTYYPLEDIEVTFHPANIKLDSSHLDLSDGNECKKMIQYFFPNIVVTNKYGKDDIIKISTCSGCM